MGFIPGIQSTSVNVIHRVNSIKGRNHVVISVDTENEFDKIQHPFVIKALDKLGIERTSSLIKSVHEEPAVNIVLHGKGWPLFSSVGERQGRLLLRFRSASCWLRPGQSREKMTRKASTAEGRRRTTSLCRRRDLVHRDFKGIH